MDKDPFELRRLPAHPAPAGLWQAIDRRLDRGGPRTPAGRTARWRWPVLATAATLMLAVAVGLVMRDATGPQPGPVTDAAGMDLAEARQLSALLEARLAENRGNVLGPDEVAELVWIESELRLTDELLAARPQSAELWARRARLLEEMNQRYRTNDWQAQMRLASY